MARKSFDERREEILRASVRVVLSRGFGDTSVRDLAKELGVSSGLLHHYFASMDEVLAAALDLVVTEDLEQLEQALATADDPVERMAALVTFAVPRQGDPSCQLWVDAWTEGLHRAALREPVAGLTRAWHRVVQRLVDEGVAAGTWRVADPTATAWAIEALLDGITVHVSVVGTVGYAQGLDVARQGVASLLGLEPGALGGRRPRKRTPARTVRTQPAPPPAASPARSRRAPAR